VNNRIDNCFARLRSEKRKGFIPYICAGDPTLASTVALSLALEKAGADILELGLPFSDPLADGIVNQLAAQRALQAGATVPGVLDCVGQIRKRSEIPIVIYTYMNPIFQFGLEQFHREAASAGVDGLLILDLPPEEDFAEPGEAGQLLQQEEAQSRKEPNRRSWTTQPIDPIDCPPGAKRVDLATGNLIHIRLVAPTTPPERIGEIAKGAKGFIYYVSREGVTGAREKIASSLTDKVAQLRQLAALPIAVGFGISTPEQAREVAQQADAVVVGSAIVNEIAKHGAEANLVERVVAMVKPMIDAVRTIER
jgi:tryptophan synthase alpha chain